MPWGKGGQAMTKEQCREAGATMIAWANGKTIQWRRRGHNDWSEVDQDCIGITLSWDWDEFQYRIKPESKLRPWTEDEVPLGAWMRFKNNPQDRVLIGWVSVQADRDLWLGEREHSIDGGKTWLPCGVEEAKP